MEQWLLIRLPWIMIRAHHRDYQRQRSTISPPLSPSLFHTLSISLSKAGHKTDVKTPDKAIPHILHKLVHIKSKTKSKSFITFRLFVSRVSSIFLLIFYNTWKHKKKYSKRFVTLHLTSFFTSFPLCHFLSLQKIHLQKIVTKKIQINLFFSA